MECHRDPLGELACHWPPGHRLPHLGRAHALYCDPSQIAHHPNTKRRLTLITINADNQASAFDEKFLARLGRFNIDTPLLGTFEGIDSLNSFY